MNRAYLVGGFLRWTHALERIPFSATVYLEDHEVFDVKTLAKVELILKAEQEAIHAKMGSRLTSLKVSTFQPFETEPPKAHGETELARAKADLLELQAGRHRAAADPDTHLNECSTTMPPVESRLVIELAPGVLLHARRDTFAQHRDDKLTFHLEAGGTYIGRPRWTHA